ncbi:hypothetical protein E5288_WYG013214 [Bos mutus]|uniref:Uncharacterized protein n=1 Tax=Bos mutus TaxID=72004 RepID=A0A6B0RSB6_9CETA|nr:hypothetical protein [Bos mutus]
MGNQQGLDRASVKAVKARDISLSKVTAVADEVIKEALITDIEVIKENTKYEMQLHTRSNCYFENEKQQNFRKIEAILDNVVTSGTTESGKYLVY